MARAGRSGRASADTGGEHGRDRGRGHGGGVHVSLSLTAVMDLSSYSSSMARGRCAASCRRLSGGSTRGERASAASGRRGGPHVQSARPFAVGVVRDLEKGTGGGGSHAGFGGGSTSGRRVPRGPWWRTAAAGQQQAWGRPRVAAGRPRRRSAATHR